MNSDHQEPSTSASIEQSLEIINVTNQKSDAATEETDDATIAAAAKEDKDLDKMMTVEEFLVKSKTYMLDYEKHMFLDTIDSDCLVVCAKWVIENR